MYTKDKLRSAFALLGKLLLFLVPLALVLGWFELQLARHPEELERKQIAWKQACGGTRLLILGSSHALFGLRPDGFSQPAFNLGWVSQTLYYDSSLLELSMRSMPHLETVIQTVSYFTLEEELDDPRVTGRAWAYWRLFGIEPLPQIPRLDSRRFSRLVAQGNWRSVQWAMHGFGPREEMLHVRADGWGDPVVPVCQRAQDSSYARERMRDWRSTMFPQKRQAQLVRLGAMARLAKSRGVRFLLVTTPILPEMRALENPKEREWMRRSLDSMARREGISWFDLESDPDFRPQDFLDMDHLAPEGALRFSRRIDSLMKVTAARN